MNRKNARDVKFHREAMIGSTDKTCIVYYDGDDSMLKFDRDFPGGCVDNFKNVLKSQFYIFGPGVYYLTLCDDGVFMEEFVSCLYSDKFPTGLVRIDLEGERVYEYKLEDDTGVH